MFENDIDDLEEFRDMLFYHIKKNGFEATRSNLKRSGNPIIKIYGNSEEILVEIRDANSGNYFLSKEHMQAVISTPELPPHSMINDSMTYRAGYAKALLDLGLIDDLSASRILINIEQMEGWEK